MRQSKPTFLPSSTPLAQASTQVEEMCNGGQIGSMPDGTLLGSSKCYPGIDQVSYNATIGGKGRINLLVHAKLLASASPPIERCEETLEKLIFTWVVSE